MVTVTLELTRFKSMEKLICIEFKCIDLSLCVKMEYPLKDMVSYIRRVLLISIIYIHYMMKLPLQHGFNMSTLPKSPYFTITSKG